MEYILHDEIERLEGQIFKLTRDKSYLERDIVKLIKYIAVKQMNIKSGLQDKEIKRIKIITKHTIARNAEIRHEMYYDALKELDLID